MKLRRQVSNRTSEGKQDRLLEEVIAGLSADLNLECGYISINPS